MDSVIKASDWSWLEPIVSLKGEHYYLCSCPWHDDEKPSLMVYKDGWIECKAGCGKKGYLREELKAKVEAGFKGIGRVELPAALPTSLDDLRDFVALAHRTMREIPMAQAYPKKRGIQSRIIPNKLGYHQGWMTMPIYGWENELKGVFLRATDEIAARYTFRFNQPAGQSSLLYVPDLELYRAAPVVLIVFGMIDALSLAALGYPCATTTSGKDSFKAEWLDDLKTKVVIGDRGEDDAADELSEELGSCGAVEHLRFPMPWMKDVNDFVTAGKTKHLKEQLDVILARYTHGGVPLLPEPRRAEVSVPAARRTKQATQRRVGAVPQMHKASRSRKAA